MISFIFNSRYDVLTETNPVTNSDFNKIVSCRCHLKSTPSGFPSNPRYLSVVVSGFPRCVTGKYCKLYTYLLFCTSFEGLYTSTYMPHQSLHCFFF